MPSTMPITWPSRLSSGPPELPGLTAASIWIKPVQILPAAGGFEGTVEAGNDAGAHRAVQTEGIADHVSLIPDLHGVQVAQSGGHELRRGLVCAQDGDVILRLRGGHLGGGLGAIREGQLDAGRVGDDVQGGEDVAAIVDDNAAPQAALALAVRAGGLGLHEHQGGLDDLVYALGKGWLWGGGSEHLGGDIADFIRGQWVLGGGEDVVKQ